MTEFQRQMSGPDPAAPEGILRRIRGEVERRDWQRVIAYTGAGWFRNRFLYLFGEGLERLQECLDAWSFFIPEHRDRIVIGKTAHGALFCLESFNDDWAHQAVTVVDPVRLELFRDENLDLPALIHHWLPEPRTWMREVLDSSLYDQVIERSELKLELDEILAFKKPMPFGGALEPSNLQLENIVEYYRSTAPIYADALAQARANRDRQRDK